VDEFVNADTIALGLSAYRPEAAAVAAGRVMLERLRFLARAVTLRSRPRSRAAGTRDGSGRSVPAVTRLIAARALAAETSVNDHIAWTRIQEAR
jgi:hypothetical protein